MIKPPISMVVGLTVVIIGGVTLIYWAGNQPVSEPLPAPVRLSTSATEAPGLHATAEPEATATAPGTGSTPLVETYRQDMDALRQEVALLRREVAAMQQQQLRTQRQTAPETLQEREESAARDPHTDPIARAEEERARHERMELLETTFWQEPTDLQWAGTTAAAVQMALVRDDIGQLALRSLECRSRSCRVELADDNTGELAKSLPLFMQHLVETLPYVTANEVVDGAGGTRVILYMSRDTSDDWP